MSTAPDFQFATPLPATSPTARLAVIVPLVTSLSERIESLARQTETGSLAAGRLAPELLALVAGMMRDMGSDAITVEALLRFADIDRDHPEKPTPATAALPAPHETMAPPPPTAPTWVEPAPAPAVPSTPTPPRARSTDPLIRHAETSAEITWLILTGMTAEHAAQRVARRFILGGHDEMIPNVGDDPRGFRRLLSWRQQMMSGRFGEAVHAAYTRALADIKANGGPPDQG